MKKLNLGCGKNYIDGWINIDVGNVKCDINHDIEIFPWPLLSSSIKEVKMQHILEHIDKNNFIYFLRELYRVCCNKSKIYIISPYAGSDNFWTDPTHKMPLTTRTFDFFDPNKALNENGKIYGWQDILFNVLEAKLVENLPNGPDVKFILEVLKNE